jgi:predicted acyl esterase
LKRWITLYFLADLYCNATEFLIYQIEIADLIKLVLYASSTNKDTDFVVKIYDQFPQSDEDRKKQINPNARVITKGWLKASHREIDASKSIEFNLWYTYKNPKAIEPNKVTKFEIAVMPTAYQFKKGNRIRIDLSNGDLGLTEYGFFQHEYTPNKLGKDTIMYNN